MVLGVPPTRCIYEISWLPDSRTLSTEDTDQPAVACSLSPVIRPKRKNFQGQPSLLAIPAFPRSVYLNLPLPGKPPARLIFLKHYFCFIILIKHYMAPHAYRSLNPFVWVSRSFIVGPTYLLAGPPLPFYTGSHFSRLAYTPPCAPASESPSPAQRGAQLRSMND